MSTGQRRADGLAGEGRHVRDRDHCLYFEPGDPEDKPPSGVVPSDSDAVATVPPAASREACGRRGVHRSRAEGMTRINTLKSYIIYAHRTICFVI